MIFDGLIMSAAANEMRRNLLGARVDKIYQPFGLKLTMTVRQPGKNIKILISAEPKTARVHITQAEYENPYNPPPFCKLLRKHLISSRIIQIDQVGLDRILRITFLRSPEETPKVLVVET
ncbi:MAG: fibronectin/fibrinogen-binding protein, partial [Firmicutes bacterium]|nr:fibronectin/fibrinogen-binding protein [Bacillota bacterium]